MISARIVFTSTAFPIVFNLGKQKPKMDFIRAPIIDGITSLRRMKKREVISQVLSLATVVLSALMLWKGLMVVTGSESPIVVVLSGSMQPAFQRGDLLFLTMDDSPIEVGDIVVFKVRQAASVVE
jgi:hypothetical protein